MTQTIRILGIDPGLRKTGWGLVETSGSRLVYVDHGVISIDPKRDLAQRLSGIFEAIQDLVLSYRPHLAGVEETLINSNPRSALKLGQARGVALAALAVNGLEVSEFAPRAIKLAVVGSGAADKTQVAFMVRRLLPKAGEMCFDAADALACAICTAHSRDTVSSRQGQAI
ncbi:MAG: crossover junction endodeoxyribonuclease RuvC [Henriciella sp.]